MTKSFAETNTIFILLEILLACVLLGIWYFGRLSYEIFFAIIAIGITVFITYRQEFQLSKITNIGIQTNYLAQKLQSDYIIMDSINRFFSLNKVIHSGKKFKIVFPVYNQQKPLPLLNQGDFYAIHIITSRISENSVDLIQIPDNISDEDLPVIDETNPIIYICAPQANKALNKLYHFEPIHSDSDCEKLKNGNWPIEKLKLPCWFIEDYRDPSWPIRSIYILDSVIPGSKPKILKSPAENLYKEAKRNKLPVSDVNKESEKDKLPSEDLNKEPKKKDVGFRHPTSIHDYAIFGRITRDNDEKSRCFILAGIHQYGTWTVAKLLRNIINNNENLDFKSIYLSDFDFIAVIEGEFNFKKLDIDDNDIKVIFNYFWVKDEGKWKKADSKGKIINEKSKKQEVIPDGE